ncbi:MAG: hypothetical protein ACTHMV_08230 [Chitinophagaceae bacterium]
MKPLKLLPALALIFLISSCESDVDEPPTPKPGADETKLMEIDKDVFSLPGSASYPEIRALVTVDSNQRTITTWFDNDIAKDGYERRYFDEAWRLTKVVTDNPALSSTKDSVLIKRSGVGIFDIEGGGKIFRYTVSSTPDGGKTISVLELNDSQFQSRMVIDKNGLLVYSAVDQQAESGFPRHWFHHFSYNADRQLIKVKDTAYFMPAVRVFEHTITKNSSDNSAFISVMKKMVGTDLSDWILYDARNGIPPFRFVYEFSNFLFLQNGAFVTNRYPVFEALDGVNFEPSPVGNGVPGNVYEYGYEYEHDNKGRMTSMKEIENSKLTVQFRFRYFD